MPKVVDHEARRAALLDGAEAAFSMHGYAALGMRELARELGVSTGTLYHYFPSKQALFEGLAERVVSRDLEGLAPVLREGLPPPARLDALMEWLAANEATFASQLLVSLEGARMQGEDAEGLRVSLWRVHRRYVEATAAGLGLPEAEAELVVHAISGAMLQRMLDGGRTPLAPLRRVLGRWLEPRAADDPAQAREPARARTPAQTRKPAQAREPAQARAPAQTRKKR